MRPPLTAAEAAEQLDVSRETRDRLQTYLDVLCQWQRAINLVGASTLQDPWRRHILDCGQLLRHLQAHTRTLVDLGSGAGLPGLVLAIMGVPEVHLIESNGRKAQFLREAARRTGAPAEVHAQRIEAMTPFRADVVTARALAPVAGLVGLAQPFLGAGSTVLLLKGRKAGAELTAAEQCWHMRIERFPSLSDAGGVVLRLSEITA